MSELFPNEREQALEARRVELEMRVSFQEQALSELSEALADVLKEAHETTAFAMAALVLLHVAGALKHQVIDRDGLMARMGFGR